MPSVADSEHSQPFDSRSSGYRQYKKSTLESAIKALGESLPPAETRPGDLRETTSATATPTTSSRRRQLLFDLEWGRPGTLVGVL